MRGWNPLFIGHREGIAFVDEYHRENQGMSLWIEDDRI
jgi:hypothetical protein